LKFSGIFQFLYSGALSTGGNTLQLTNDQCRYSAVFTRTENSLLKIDGIGQLSTTGPNQVTVASSNVVYDLEYFGSTAATYDATLTPAWGGDMD